MDAMSTLIVSNSRVQQLPPGRRLRGFIISGDPVKTAPATESLEGGYPNINFEERRLLLLDAIPTEYTEIPLGSM